MTSKSVWAGASQAGPKSGIGPTTVVDRVAVNNWRASKASQAIHEDLAGRDFFWNPRATLRMNGTDKLCRRFNMLDLRDSGQGSDILGKG